MLIVRLHELTVKKIKIETYLIKLLFFMSEGVGDYV